MLVLGIGSMVAHSGTRGILRRVLEGGVFDRSRLPPGFVEQLFQCGEANRRVIPARHSTTLERCGHFSSLDQPAVVARLIEEEVR